MVAMPARAPSVPVLIATVFVPFGLGYYLSYLFRTVNAVISPQLVAEVGLTPADLGLMTSLYFILFAAVQIPLGIALDRYGPRKVQVVLLCVAGAGGVVFAVGQDFNVLALGRSLIGLGVSGCLMAMLQSNILWWPRERLALLNAVTGAVGSVGALSATLPVELLLSLLDWRSIFLALAAVTVAVAALILLIVPDRRVTEGVSTDVRGQMRDLRHIYTHGYFWRLTVMISVGAAVFLSYQTLWAAPWLRDVAGFDRLAVANGLLLFNVGMFIGVLSIGALADRLQRVGVPIVATVAGAFCTMVLVQVAMVLELTGAASLLCFLFGFTGSSTILAYSVYPRIFPAALIGRVNTAQNMSIFVVAFVMQWAIGAIIGLYPQPVEGRYSPEGHRAALIVLIGCQALAFAWFAWPRRKKD